MPPLFFWNHLAFYDQTNNGGLRMRTQKWIKLDTAMLDDLTISRLPDHLWRRLVELFLLAGREQQEGALPPVREMAWRLHLPEDRLLEDLHHLEEAGLVHAHPYAWSQPHQWFMTPSNYVKFGHHRAFVLGV
jgi:hypothetical protein